MVMVAHGMSPVLMLSVGLAICILVAHLASYRPKAKRMIGAALLASMLAGVAVLHAEDVISPISVLCKDLTPWDVAYWWLECYFAS